MIIPVLTRPLLMVLEDQPREDPSCRRGREEAPRFGFAPRQQRAYANAG